jgi:hypothetical protein
LTVIDFRDAIARVMQRGKDAPLGMTERRGLAVARTRQVGRNLGEHASGSRAHDDDAIGQYHRLVDVVGDDDQHRLAVRPQVKQMVLHVGAGEGIERRERLVEQHYLWPHDSLEIVQAPGNANAFAVTPATLTYLFWLGAVNRTDLVRRFGVSMSRASADIARYLAHDPPGVIYDRSAKGYAAQTDFRPLLGKPDATRFLGELRLVEAGILAIEDTMLGVVPRFDEHPMWRGWKSPVSVARRRPLRSRKSNRCIAPRHVAETDSVAGHIGFELWSAERL